MIITGIGSRTAPQHICYLCCEIGKYCLEHDWFVRSGHADGADYAFELGAKENCIAYLPWKGFNKERPLCATPHIEPFRKEVFDIVCQHEPHAKNLSHPIKMIKSRNVYQVLGVTLDTPSDVVICWTPNGEMAGGTALAIKIAIANNIPVINLGLSNASTTVDSILDEVFELCN